jgi:3-isopropylmalate/(R)-2-methylmalate dehydratase small subunit
MSVQENRLAMKVVSKLGDDVSTDTIYPGRFMATVLPTETPKFAFADDVELNSRLVSGEIPKGSVIVAERNFGCGSSREQAVSTLKGYDLTIVAKGIARIFLQNSINLGLKVVICPEIEAEVGDELVVEFDKVINVTTQKTFVVEGLPASKQAVIDAGGLIEYTRARLMAR